MTAVYDPLGNAADFPWPSGDPRGSTEKWYGLAGPEDGSFAFWFRFTLDRTVEGEREGRIWAGITDREDPTAGFFVSRRLNADHVYIDNEPFLYRAPDGLGEIGDDHNQGRLDSPLGEISWDLRYEPDPFSWTLIRNATVNGIMGTLGKTRHRSVNESLRVDGHVQVGDRRYTLERAPGHQGHTASRRTARGWTWMQCNGFGDGETCLEALTMGPLTTLCLRTEGEIFSLNRLHDLVGPRANRAEDQLGRWTFSGAGEGVEVEAEVRAPEGIAWQRVCYRDPDGTLRYNAHCSLAEVTLRYRRKGQGAWRTLESRCGRVEWVRPEQVLAGDYLPADWSADWQVSRHDG
ncbi:MAG: hypothetical protein P1V51_18145 [Deltaproteobacteria bacterium]|nr:hypothetical protein [Deltaproteobacteria bacterium]